MAGIGASEFHRMGSAPTLVAAAVAFGVYFATVAPGLTFAHFGVDGGDLIAAARTLGVPHPTGYPTYTLLAWLFTQIPVGTVAYRVNLLSAVCGAVAVGLLAATAYRLLPASVPRTLVAVAAGLATAFAPLLWSQSVISEVYAVQLLLAALFVWLLLLWREEGRVVLLWCAALVLGVGLGTHVTLGFVVPAAVLLVWREARRHPRQRCGLAALAGALGLLALGIGIYGYLPLAARGDSPVCWGDPQTWDRFRWLVGGQAYRSLAFGLDAASAVGRLGEWARLVGVQFGWWGLALAVVGVGRWWQRDRTLALFSIVWSAPLLTFAFLYDAPDARVYLLPVVWLMGLAWAEGAAGVLLLVPGEGLRFGRTQIGAWRGLALSLVLALPLAALVTSWSKLDLSDDWSGQNYVEQILAAVAPNGLVVVRSDQPTFALWYGLYAEGQRPDVSVINGSLLAYDWYRARMRRLYPELVVPDPEGVRWPAGLGRGLEAPAGGDDLVYDLVAQNLALRPVYVTDPDQHWNERFDWTQEGDAPVYRVSARSS